MRKYFEVDHMKWMLITGVVEDQMSERDLVGWVHVGDMKLNGEQVEILLPENKFYELWVHHDLKAARAKLKMALRALDVSAASTSAAAADQEEG
jgi:hypothetical protein